MPPLPESLCPCHDGDDKPLLRLRDGRWEYGKAMDEWPTVQKVELRFVMTNVALQRWDVMNAIKCTGEAMDLLRTAEERGVRFPYHESAIVGLLRDVDNYRFHSREPRFAFRGVAADSFCENVSERVIDDGEVAEPHELYPAARSLDYTLEDRARKIIQESS